MTFELREPSGITTDLAARMRIQRQRNVIQLAKCDKQLRRNARLLRWWNPFKGSLVGANQELIDVRAELDHQDRRLDEWIGPREAS